MDISIIIATFNRARDLGEALDTIFLQRLLPDEIIVVDDSDTDATFQLVHSARPPVGVMVRYVKNVRGRSLTIARNVGVNVSSGQIVCFLDDDVLLDENYLSEVVAAFRARPEVLGVQGFWGASIPLLRRQWFVNLFSRLFLHFQYERSRCRVLTSGNATYPHAPVGTIPCEWLSGCNQVYRREVFSRFHFDEKLLRASFGEDLDFSFRLRTAHPNSLILVSSARLVHKGSPEARTPARRAVFLIAAYSQYLHGKKFGKRVGPRIAFLYGRLGELVLGLAGVLFPMGRPRAERLAWIRHWAAAQKFMLRHRREIAQGDLAFLEGILG